MASLSPLKISIKKHKKSSYLLNAWIRGELLITLGLKEEGLTARPRNQAGLQREHDRHQRDGKQLELGGSPPWLHPSSVCLLSNTDRIRNPNYLNRCPYSQFWQLKIDPPRHLLTISPQSIKPLWLLLWDQRRIEPFGAFMLNPEELHALRPGVLWNRALAHCQAQA